MRVLTAEQMQKVDAETIARVVPGIELMERAGRGVARAILARYGKQGKACIFVGPGNNGGDGLVVARLLCEAGWKCSVHLLKTDDLTPDTSKNYLRLDKKSVNEIDANRPDWTKVATEDLADATVIVDAIFGTGFKGAPRGRSAEMIALINATKAALKTPVIAIDIPSGVDGTTAEVAGEAIRATETITIGVPKTGLLFFPGKEHVGELSVIDIGFPPEVVDAHSSPWFYLDEEAAAKKLPKRRPDIHKYEAGRLLLIAGSDDYRGAALLAAEAALRGGCGMVYFAVPEGIRAEVSVALREAVTISLPQTKEVTIARGALEVLEEYREKADAIAIGPGLGRNDETDEFVRKFVSLSKRPVVLDADGLMAFPGHSSEFATAHAPIVITPHGGEMKRLVPDVGDGAPVERLNETLEVAKRLGCILVRKGAPTIIASPDGDAYVNAAGSSALATVGTGDVLAGLLGSLIAQGANPLDAACVACFLHGRTGELAAAEKGVRGVIAGDLMPLLGVAMRSLEARAPA
ncbi:MAG TPA: NAD(P)H-hydrate dehydratase [Candidatus Krumholzibacteria bacterium]|nr:NAD(P)H-hydrate dehydratase [Candidatus Krumholzibacteria bacterium]